MSLATESEREGRVKRSNLRDKHEDLPPARLLQTSINPKKETELTNFLMRDSDSLGSTSLWKWYSDIIVCIILFMRSMKISVLLHNASLTQWTLVKIKPWHRNWAAASLKCWMVMGSRVNWYALQGHGRTWSWSPHSSNRWQHWQENLPPRAGFAKN